MPGTRMHANSGLKAKRAAVAQLNSSFRSVKDDVSSLGGDIVDFAGAVRERARHEFAGLAGQARERGRSALETLRVRVREQPAAAVGAAVGLGVLASLILRARRRRA